MAKPIQYCKVTFKKIKKIVMKPNTSKDVEKKKSSCTVDGNENWLHLLWKAVWRFLKKKNPKNRTPYDPAIPLLCVYPKETKSLSQKRYLLSHLHYSIIYNGQDIEII